MIWFFTVLNTPPTLIWLVADNIPWLLAFLPWAVIWIMAIIVARILTKLPVAGLLALALLVVGIN